MFPEPSAVRRNRIFLLFYMLLIFMVSALPSDESLSFRFLAELKPQWQNLLHIPVYMLLAFLWLHCVRSPYERSMAVFLYANGYGIFNELVQMMIPGRFFSLLDMLLNSLGVLLGIMLFRCYKKMHKRLI
ncbi:MAG: VanZ family protein [Desulfobacterales bacterium]